MCVTQQDLLAFHPTQDLFVGAFHARSTGIVTLDIITVILNVLLVDFANVSQNIGSIGIFILPIGSVLNIKAGKFIEFLLQNTIFLCRKLVHEELRDIGRIARIEPTILDVCHPLDKLFFRDPQNLAEVQRIERLHLTHDHHHLISGLVIHQQLPVTVINQSTGWIERLFQKGIAVCPCLVVAIDNLQHEQADHVDQHQENDRPTNHVTTIFQRIFQMVILHFSEILS